ncbi:MAG: ADOP family duplicated permease [Gemmatimonadota bacterium]
MPPILRIILLMYPRAYRERYGAEIADVVARDEAASGGGVRFWARVVVDHVFAARRVRRRERATGRGEMIFEDARAAIRSVTRARRFALFASITLGLGIGATASVLTVLDRVVLRPLPWDAPERLVQIGTYIMGGDELAVLSGPLLRDFVEELDVVETVIGATRARPVRGDLTAPVQLSAMRVSAGYFPFFEGRAVAGRLLDEADHAEGAGPVVVLSHAYWNEAFGADPSAVGASMELDGVRHTVVGVLDPTFTAPRPEFWGDHDVLMPIGLYQRELSEGSFGIQAAVRLRPGISEPALNSQLERVGRQRYEDEDGFVSGFGSHPLRDTVIGPEVARNLGRVAGAVLLLLLVGCVNVASLLLTRAAQRTHEFRTRVSLGATRPRLLAQLCWESVSLALLGSLFGSAIAWAGVEFFRLNAPAGVPRIAEISFDPRAFLLTVVLSLGTVLIFGLAPSWTASRARGISLNRSRSSPTRGASRLRSGLVGVETGLAAALVIWSGLLARDLVEMTTEHPGFTGESLVAASINLGGRPDGASHETMRDFVRRLDEAARAVPGVTSVAFATELPYSGNALVASMTPLESPDVAEGTFVPIVAIEGDYFDALGLRFVQGVPFDTRTDDDQMLAVVNEAFVEQYWPGLDPLRQSIKSGGEDVDDEGVYRVVGVVADVRTEPGQPAPAKMYADYTNESFGRFNVLLEVGGPGEPAVQALRAAVATLDPGLPLNEVTTLAAVEARALERPTFYALIFSTFGLAALALALIGVYGTTAYATAARHKEIGIRVALGEGEQRIVRMILRRTVVVVSVGAALGAGLALLGGRLASDALRLVHYADPLTYLGVMAWVVGTAAIAAWLPARRLTRVDPSEALRGESG